MSQDKAKELADTTIETLLNFPTTFEAWWRGLDAAERGEIKKKLRREYVHVLRRQD